MWTAREYITQLIPVSYTHLAQVINSLRDNLEAEQCTCTQQFTEECHDNQDFGITPVSYTHLVSLHLTFSR